MSGNEARNEDRRDSFSSHVTIFKRGPSSNATPPSLNGKSSSGWSLSFPTIARPAPALKAAISRLHRDRRPPQPSEPLPPPPSGSPPSPPTPPLSEDPLPPPPLTEPPPNSAPHPRRKSSPPPSLTASLPRPAPPPPSQRPPSPPQSPPLPVPPPPAHLPLWSSCRRPPPSTTRTHRPTSSLPPLPGIRIPLLPWPTHLSASSSTRVVRLPRPAHSSKSSSPRTHSPRSSSPAPIYSLPPLPPWPPARLEYPSDKNFKVLFDSAVDNDRDSKFALLIGKVREAGAAGTRIKTEGGNETLLRFEGEVVLGEPEVVPADPRKTGGFKRQATLRPFRTELYVVKYEHDENSSGPPAPTSVPLANVLPLAPKEQIRRNSGVAAAPPPLLGAKLTVYKLLNMTTMFAFCIKKDLLTYKGLTIEPTTLDLVSGLLAPVLYWIGQYEGEKKLEWFFDFDLAHPTLYGAKFVIREGRLVSGDCQLFTLTMVLSLGQYAVPLLFHSYPHVNGAVQWAVRLGVSLVLWYLIGVLIPRVLKRVQEPVSTWMSAMTRFIKRVIGPALLAKQRGWFHRMSIIIQRVREEVQVFVSNLTFARTRSHMAVLDVGLPLFARSYLLMTKIEIPCYSWFLISIDVHPGDLEGLQWIVIPSILTFIHLIMLISISLYLRSRGNGCLF